MPNWTRTISDSKLDKHLYLIAKKMEKIGVLTIPDTTTTTVHP